MNRMKYLFKIIIWSFVICIIVQFCFGAYAAFGPMTLIAVLLIALAGSFILSASSTVGYTVISLLHLVFTTGFYIFLDSLEIFNFIPDKSTEFLLKFSGRTQFETDIIWCMIPVMLAYFFSYLIFSSIISSLKMKKIAKANEFPTIENDSVQ